MQGTREMTGDVQEIPEDRLSRPSPEPQDHTSSSPFFHVERGDLAALIVRVVSCARRDE